MITLLTFQLGMAQSDRQIVDALQELMLERYIFLDKAQQVNSHLDSLVEDGYFEAFKQPAELADEITRQMRKITHDFHLGVLPPRQVEPQATAAAPDPLEGLQRYNPSMINGYQYFEQNVGYFDMRFFGGGPDNLGLLDNTLEKLLKADALIIDVRNSLGGSPRTVQYLCSYFFDQDILLGSIYSRHDDQAVEFRTRPVNGQKRPQVPVFILTSDRSFSAAEDFPYTMQAQGRATIVGEVTRGGAHPTRSHDLPGGFRIRIPFARSINPITQSNWEGVGVIPNVEVPEDQALAKAQTLAAEAAVKFKEDRFAPLLTVLNSIHRKPPTGSQEESIQERLKQMLTEGILNERDINRFGYNYFLMGKKEAALAIFKANTLLYPDSANAFDSYAEALADMGQSAQALNNYKKAVALAKAQNHINLAVFEQNLAAFDRKEK